MRSVQVCCHPLSEAGRLWSALVSRRNGYRHHRSGLYAGHTYADGRAVTLVANRGKHVQPRLVVENLPEVQRPQWGEDITLKEVDWDFVIKGMENVISHKRGTAHWRIGRNLRYRIAGKTGTAQVVSIAQGEDYDAEKLKEFQRDHSLFVAFAPIEDPQIALSVIVENSKGAANVAREIMDFYLLPRLKAKAEKGGK